MKNFFLLIIAAAFLSVTTNSCKKDSLITSMAAGLSISADSIKFDTVFTSTGSVTRSFKIVNENDQRLRLSNVKLMGGNGSAFKLNINGIATTELNNIEIAANDSIYIFVSVSINPTAANLPFIISDSISIQYNNNQRWVQLQSYGKNARFLNSQSIGSNTSWNNSLPYVILGALYIAPDANLTINAGTKVHVHANAPVIVDGTLTANGSFDNKIVFTGDRLDEPYNNFPASWPGIIFRSSSKNNFLKFCNIINAYQAVVVLDPSPNANPKLIMEQCIIDNAYSAGLICSNTNVQASNTLISNCANNIVIESGGNYIFTHCTAASYTSSYITHKKPVLSVANFGSFSGSPLTNPLQANFTNCIFWGDTGFIDNEIMVSKQGTSTFNVSINNSLYRAAADPSNSILANNIKNQDPLFDSIDVSKRYYNFNISISQAPGINKGMPTTFLKDLNNNSRSVGLPDMGCYEKQ